MAHRSEESVALRHRAQRACDEITTVSNEVAITLAETQRLLAIARQTSSADQWIVPTAAIPFIAEEPPTEVDPQDLAMEVLRMMRELLNGFPLEWQVMIVKALTAHTMLLAAAQMHKPPITLSA